MTGRWYDGVVRRVGSRASCITGIYDGSDAAEKWFTPRPYRTMIGRRSFTSDTDIHVVSARQMAVCRSGGVTGWCDGLRHAPVASLVPMMNTPRLDAGPPSDHNEPNHIRGCVCRSHGVAHGHSFLFVLIHRGLGISPPPPAVRTVLRGCTICCGMSNVVACLIKSAGAPVRLINGM